MNTDFSAIAAAAWLGFLCSISPCPMTTNIAAISFVGRKVGKVNHVLAAGILYTLGQISAYTVLGILLVNGTAAAPELSNVLQKYAHLFMGPLLMLVAMVLLGFFKFRSFPDGGISESVRGTVERQGIWGAFLLGAVFAVSFCPTSAALFFGSLLPLAMKFKSGFVLPAVFGMATGLPVLLFAFLLAFGANKLGKVCNELARFERIAQKATGTVFMVIGILLTFITLLQIGWL